MCNVDTGLQPWVWAGDPAHPTPDFSRAHKCKNFKGIREWAERKQELKMKDLPILTPPEGARILDEIP